MILSFPGGAGGHWLRKVILNDPVAGNALNFHNEYTGEHISFNHSVDPSEFDYLYSGSYYFNFYINVLLKHFNEMDWFREKDYQDTFLECVNTARHICKFSKLTQDVFFNFDDLINSPNKFLGQINQMQTIMNVSQTHEDEFLNYRDKFFSTCVNPTGTYENFENMSWIAFVLGQLMTVDCVPLEFSIGEFDNQELCKEFAKKHYELCKLNNVYYFDTNLYLPDLLDK
jgi:hypothetical protein